MRGRGSGLQAFWRKMAGNIGAKISRPAMPLLPIFNPNRANHLFFLHFPPVLGIRTIMVKPSEISTELKEPALKLQKLDSNGHQAQPNSSDSTIEPLLRVKKLSENAVLPSRGSPLSAGYDLSSASAATVPARGKAMVATDLSIAVPEGTYGRIAPRSGLAWKHSIDVGAGVIDADYRGPVGVVLFNHSDADVEVKAGDRIAQLIIEKIMTPQVLEVEDLDFTSRGAGGFGSTGV